MSWLIATRAATLSIAFEPESGVLAAGTTNVANTNASGGRALAFAGGATPTPAPTPTVTPAPPIGNPAWRGDYQTSLLSGWSSEQQMVRPAQQTRLTAASAGIPTRPGFPYVARFITAPGDYTNGGTSAERSEVYASVADTGNPVNGQTMWWAWSMYIPAGFQVDSNAESPIGNGWLIATQWHSSSSGGNPYINFGFQKGIANPHLVVGTGVGNGSAQEWTSPNPYPLGQWVDFRLGVTWGNSTSTGRITLKMNGTTIINNQPSSNLGSGYSAYLKQGIYRGSSNRTTTIYYTGTRRGTTEASVTY